MSIPPHGNDSRPPQYQAERYVSRGAYLHGEPRPGRRHPVKADKPRSGGAGRASLEGMAPVWPHGNKQVTVLGTLTAPARVSG